MLPNGKSLGNYENGYIVGAYHKSKPILVVNVLPGDEYWEGDLIPPMKKALNWYATQSWLSIVPDNEQLIVDIGENSEITLKMNAVEKQGGLYRGEIRLTLNDPEKRSV